MVGFYLDTTVVYDDVCIYAFSFSSSSSALSLSLALFFLSIAEQQKHLPCQ